MLILTAWVVMCPMTTLKADEATVEEADVAIRGRVGGRVGGVRAGVAAGPRGRAVGYARTPAFGRTGAYAAGYHRGYVGGAAYPNATYYYPTTPYYTQYYPYY